MAPKKWRNSKGQEVPAVYVPKIDKEREKLVKKYIDKAQKLNASLIMFKKDLIDDCDAFIEQMFKENNVKQEGKGNYSLTSFDKELKIEINVQDRIEFDDTIQVAHAKIKEYLADITKDANSDIQVIVNSAFQTSKGKMDVKRILGLFEYKITHPKWVEAMELIQNSISRNSSKRYVRLWIKNAAGEYDSIELNFSSL